MKPPPPSLKPHRRARLVLWARTMLVWAALMLFSSTEHADRRRIRQRYRFFSLVTIERLLRALLLIRAAEIAQPRNAPKAPRSAAPEGFRRRVHRGALLRATLGSRLRKALRHRDRRERIARLIAAFADIDGFARRYLVPRARRRLTKLCAVIIAAPSACALESLTARAPRAADSS